MKTNYGFSRRSFLGASLLSIPLVRVVARAAKIREDVYTIRFGNSAELIITTFTNGHLEGSFRGRPMETRQQGTWTRLSCQHAEILCRRVKSRILDIAWVAMVEPTEGHSWDDISLVEFAPKFL